MTGPAFHSTGTATSFTLDNTAPTASLSSPTNNVFVHNSITLQATASDTNLNLVDFLVDGVDKGAGKLVRRRLVVLVEHDHAHRWQPHVVSQGSRPGRQHHHAGSVYY